MNSRTIRRENPFVEIPPLALVGARFAVVAYFLTTVVAAANSQTAADTTVFRVFAVAALLLSSCAPLIFRLRGIGVFHPLYFLAAYNFLRGTIPSLRPMAVGITSHAALPGTPASSIAVLQVYVILLSALSWIVMIAGYRASKGISWKFVSISDRHKPVVRGSAIAFAVGAYGFVKLISISGGFWAHLKNITRGFAAKVWVVDPELASTYAFLVNLTLIAPAYLMLTKRNATRSLVFWGAALGSAAMLFMVNGRRSALLQPVLVLVCCWILRRRKVALGRVGFIVLLLFLSAGLVGEFRRENWGHGSNVSFEFLGDMDVTTAFQMSLSVIENRHEGGAMYPILARVPDEVEYLYGTNYLAYVYRFIPRVIWEDKPRGVGVDCGRIFYGVRHGVPPGSLGEAYWSGGVIGIVLVFFLWGACLRSFASFFVRFQDSSVACMLYLMTLAVLSPNEPSFRAWLYFIVPAVGVLAVGGILRFGASRRRLVPA